MDERRTLFPWIWRYLIGIFESEMKYLKRIGGASPNLVADNDMYVYSILVCPWHKRSSNSTWGVGGWVAEGEIRKWTRIQILCYQHNRRIRSDFPLLHSCYRILFSYKSCKRISDRPCSVRCVCVLSISLSLLRGGVEEEVVDCKIQLRLSMG